MIGLEGDTTGSCFDTLYDQSFLGRDNCRRGCLAALTPISRKYTLGRSSHHTGFVGGLRARTWHRVDAYFKLFANVGLSIHVLPCVSHPMCVYASVSLGVLDYSQLHSDDLLSFVESR